MALRIPSRCFPGPLHAGNKSSHWAWQGLLAYPCHNVVIVVEPTSAQVVQTLEHDKCVVTKVEWAREYFHHSLADPYSLSLASADTSGKIVIWNARDATVKAECFESSKPIVDMKWLANEGATRDLLAVLHPTSTLVIWNADTGAKVWKKTFSEPLLGFSLDPFNNTELAILSHDCLFFLDDFSGMKPPSKAPKKFYVSGGGGGSKKATSALRKVRQQLVGEPKKSSDVDSISLSDCLQMMHSPSCRHHLFLVYPREILILDLQIHQTVGSIAMERNGSSFQQIVAARQRDLLYCLHENGCISVRTRRRHPPASRSQLSSSAPPQSTTQSQTHFDVIYDLRCQSDPLRLSKQNRAVQMSLDPIFERTLSLLLIDGRLLFWHLLSSKRPYSSPTQQQPSSLSSTSTLSTPLPSVFGGSVSSFADHMLQSPLPPPTLTSHNSIPPLLPNNCGSSSSSSSTAQFGLSDLFSSLSLPCNRIEGESVQVILKMVMAGLLESCCSPPLCLKMCPPLTTKNWNFYKPHLAAGTSTGVVQIFDLHSSSLYKEFTIHTCSIRGIEWLDLSTFLTYAFVGSSLGKNEVKMTRVSTGQVSVLRDCKEEEAPIESIQVSHLKQYFLILIKDKPVELWDVSSLNVLREIRVEGRVTAMTWSPAHGHQRRIAAGSASSSKDAKIPSKEHFVLVDSIGFLCHYVADGSGSCREASKVAVEGGLSTVTALAWKNDNLVLGDVDGQIGFWQLKGKMARTISTYRSTVKKIKFAPGKGNLMIFVLYSNGNLDVLDPDSGQTLSSVKPSREGFNVQDVEWAASDKPVMACSNGCLIISHYSREKSSDLTPIVSLQQSSSGGGGGGGDEYFNPRILLPKANFFLKTLLQHQSWNSHYELDLTKMFGDEETMDVIPRTAYHHIQSLDSSIKEFLMNPRFGTAERCLLIAKLFGDEFEAYFWEVALFYLLHEKIKRNDPNYKSYLDAELVNPSSDIFRPERGSSASGGGDGGGEDKSTIDEEATTEKGKEDVEQIAAQIKKEGIPILDTCYDLLLPRRDLQRLELHRLALHDTKRVTYEHTQKCAEKMIYLKQTDRAVQVLLETASENEQHYYTDALRACLVATIRSSGVSQSTIKLVATNLIANGKLSEGVQLLTLIDKGLDASRYLQTYGEWNEAAFLAKSTLNERECGEVFSRWADHLASPSINQKASALLLFLSLGLFSRVLEMLYSMRWFDMAALFAEVCLDLKVVDETAPETTALIEAIFLEYARFQLTVDNKAAAKYYSLKAGINGSQLMKTVSSE